MGIRSTDPARSYFTRFREVLENSSGGGGGGGGAFSATGGTEYTPGNGYKYHTFTTSGSFIVTGPSNVEVLMVAGGGSAGPGYNAGAGGGGVVHHQLFPVTAQTYPVTVGTGAPGPRSTKYKWWRYYIWRNDC